MNGINKAIIVGYVGADADFKETANAKITTISVATNEKWFDKNNKEKKEHVEWHKVVLFNKLAEIAHQYLKKGSKVYVEGSIRTKCWQDEITMQKKYFTEIIAQKLQMLDKSQNSNKSEETNYNTEYHCNQNSMSYSEQKYGF